MYILHNVFNGLSHFFAARVRAADVQRSPAVKFSVSQYASFREGNLPRVVGRALLDMLNCRLQLFRQQVFPPDHVYPHAEVVEDVSLLA